MNNDRTIYENGTVRLEVRDDIIWLQNGNAGFWMQDDEFDNLIEMIVELYGPKLEGVCDHG